MIDSWTLSANRAPNLQFAAHKSTALPRRFFCACDFSADIRRRRDRRAKRIFRADQKARDSPLPTSLSEPHQGFWWAKKKPPKPKLKRFLLPTFLQVLEAISQQFVDVMHTYTNHHEVQHMF